MVSRIPSRSSPIYHRPDHIVVGEVRGAEAADLLQALNTGHGVNATAFLPMHPDAPDVWSILSGPIYLGIALAGLELERTPLRATIDGQPGTTRSELIRKRIDWSFDRPDLVMGLAPGILLRGLGDGTGATLEVHGPATGIRLTLEPLPGLAIAAWRMSGNCPGSGGPA